MKKHIKIIAGCVVGLVLIGVGAYALSYDSNNSDQADSNDSQTETSEQSKEQLTDEIPTKEGLDQPTITNIENDAETPSEEATTETEATLEITEPGGSIVEPEPTVTQESVETTQPDAVYLRGEYSDQIKAYNP